MSVLSNPRADHMVIRRQADEAQNNQFFLFGQVLDSFSKLSLTEKLSNVEEGGLLQSKSNTYNTVHMA